MKTNQINDLYEFGEFRLDAKKRRLWKNEELVSLTPKEFEVLFVLISNAGKVVEKDELLDAVWKDIYVEEATLTRNISFLRKKLGTDKFIETLPKRGYRFLPTVRKIENDLAKLATEENRIDSVNISKPKSKNIWSILVVVIFGVLSFTASTLLIYQNYFRETLPETITVSQVVPFSGLAGRENMPAFSPDGKQIVFVWNGGNETDNFDVYLKLIGSGEPIRLTKNDADDLFPTFAPDGKSIAFLRSYPTHSEIFIIPALGGSERKIADLRSVRSSLSFSPDGKALVAADSDAISTVSKNFLFNTESGEKTSLSKPTENSSDDTPSFSNDGKTISFLRSFATIRQELFTIDINEGKEKQLTFDKTRIRGATFSKNGKIIFASQRVNNQWNLWQTSSGGEPQMIVTGGKNLAFPIISPDGKSVAFVEESNDTNLWKIENSANEKNPDKSDPVYQTSFVASSRADHSPNFSPDGKLVTFVSDRSGIYQIWTADSEGKNQIQLTNETNSAGSPRFSPDGKFIVFDAQVEGNGDIFIINSNGGKTRNLSDSPSRDVMPAWSSDGKFIYFTSNRSGDYQLWKISAEGGEALQLTKQGAFESFTAPNGKEIFYTKERGVTGLWKVSIDGGDSGESEITELADAGYWRYLSVTSTGIFYVSKSSNARYTIRCYDFATKQTSNISITDKPPIWLYSGLSVSDNGKTIIYAQNDQNASNIMLAEFGK
jgi:Tol biopolymer transport system component/DNA-binding winged helix-turn-helix (wHTH) protein